MFCDNTNEIYTINYKNTFVMVADDVSHTICTAIADFDVILVKNFIQLLWCI